MSMWISTLNSNLNPQSAIYYCQLSICLFQYVFQHLLQLLQVSAPVGTQGGGVLSWECVLRIPSVS